MHLVVGASYIFSRVRPWTSDRKILSAVRRYFELESSGYDTLDRVHSTRNLYLEAIEGAVADRAPLRSSGIRILSIGCGTGRREVRIRDIIQARNPDQQVDLVGVELSDGMRVLANQRGLRTYRTLDLAIEAEATFDYIIFLYSFPHLPSPAARRRALKMAHSALSPGGRIFIDVFNLDDQHEWASKIRDGGGGAQPTASGLRAGDTWYRRLGGSNQKSFMHYFTPGELLALLESCKFTITEVFGVGHGERPGRNPVNLDEGCTCVVAKPSIR